MHGSTAEDEGDNPGSIICFSVQSARFLSYY